MSAARRTPLVDIRASARQINTIVLLQVPPHASPEIQSCATGMTGYAARRFGSRIFSRNFLHAYSLAPQPTATPLPGPPGAVGERKTRSATPLAGRVVHSDIVSHALTLCRAPHAPIAFLLIKRCYTVARRSRRAALRSKNSAWLMTAETIAGWNGFAIRNAGSGRSPVRNRSG
jgi:hypothetical protein